jgi:hypothetical protein
VKNILPKLFCLAPLIVGGCVPAMLTPTVSVMPGPNKSLEVFAVEQASCKQFAEKQISDARNQLNNQIMGAALLTDSSDPVASGQAVAQSGTPVLQQQYDTAYAQCMYAKRNQVPGYQVASPTSRRHPVHRARRPIPQGEAATAKFIEPPPSTQPLSEQVVEPPPAKR